MSLDKNIEFITWLDEILVARNWSDNQLAKKAGISHSVISKARSGILPKWGACESIAHALDISPVIIFRKAGLLPPGPPDDITFDDWKEVLGRLSERDQAVLKQTALSMLDADKKGRETSAARLKTSPSKP
jgi:transcriptional regulator with XRE-family HTH domain